jgi:anti-sigma-K factor RskA
VAAVAAVVALGIGLWASSLSSDLDETRAALARTRAAAAIVADPTAQTVDLAEGNGRLVVGSEGRAALVLHDLGPAPSGKTYQAWIIEDDNPISAGVFPGDEGLDVVLLDGDVADGEVVAVTVEKAGGVEAPTTTPIVASDPV